MSDAKARELHFSLVNGLSTAKDYLRTINVLLADILMREGQGQDVRGEVFALTRIARDAEERIETLLNLACSDLSAFEAPSEELVGEECGDADPPAVGGEDRQTIH